MKSWSVVDRETRFLYCVEGLITLLAPGILWISFIFTGMLGLGRSFAGEREEGCLEGLRL